MSAAQLPQDWDFYEGAAERGRAFVSINLGARDAAPVATHSVRVQFRVQMQQPREDGLRSQEEAPALFALEDRLVAALTSTCQAHYVARVVGYGFCEFSFYVPPTQRDCGEKAEGLVGGTAPYELEWVDEDDAGWERYGELYPNRYAAQTIANRRLVAQMETAGDRLEVPRLVDHGARFEAEAAAVKAGVVLAAAGFTVDAPRAATAPGSGWFLEFHKVEPCDGENPDRFVFEVLDLLAPLGGDYDGWGSPVQSAAD